MISIVIPTLNEAENIKTLIPKIFFILKEFEKEIIIADGGSIDNTHEIIKQLRERYDHIIFFRQSEEGFANALTDGIRRAHGSIIVTMDAENHLPEEIPLLVYTLIKENADVVVGSRFLKESKVDLAKHRFFSTRIGNSIVRTALRLNVEDCSSGFRAYRSTIVKKVLNNLRTKYFSIQVELLERIKEINGNIIEIAVHYLKREKGKSKFKFTPAIKDATTLLKIARDSEIQKIKSKSKIVQSRIKSKLNVRSIKDRISRIRSSNRKIIP